MNSPPLLQADAGPLHLKPGDVLCWAAAGQRARLTVCAGRVWLTASGSLDDHFLAAGDVLELGSMGQVVVECVGEAPAELRLAWPEPVRWRTYWPSGLPRWRLLVAGAAS